MAKLRIGGATVTSAEAAETEGCDDMCAADESDQGASISGTRTWSHPWPWWRGLVAVGLVGVFAACAGDDGPGGFEPGAPTADVLDNAGDHSFQSWDCVDGTELIQVHDEGFGFSDGDWQAEDDDALGAAIAECRDLDEAPEP